MSEVTLAEDEDLNSEIASIESVDLEQLDITPVIAVELREKEDPSTSNRYGASGNPEINPNYVFEPRDTDSLKRRDQENNNNVNPMAIWYPNEIDPDSLAPTYSMVSFCPFLGKCCFFPMNFIPPHKCNTCCGEEETIKAKPVKKYVAPIPITLKEKPARTSLHKPPPPPVERKIEPQGRSIMKEVEVVSKVEEKAIIRPVPVIPKVEEEAPIRPVVDEPPPKKTKEDKFKYTEITSTEIDARDGRGSKKSVKKQPSELLASRSVVNSQVDMDLLRQESLKAFRSEYKDLEPGIQGIKALVNERSKTKSGILDFVDYFTKKDGTKYIGMLEQYFIEFFEKTKSEIEFASKNNPGFAKKAEEARKRISDTYRIVQVDDEKEIQEYDFPKTIQKDLGVFGINVSHKITQLAKIHTYANQMVLYWVKQLDKKKSIDPLSIYHTGTELMADVMVIVYSIYAKLADFFVQIVTHPTQRQVDVYKLEFFMRAFRNLVDGICDEVGAIGESCGQVMIRIESLPRDKVVEVMTMLYKQVNYAHVSMSRAMESLAPAILLFYIRFNLDIEKNRHRITNARAEDNKNDQGRPRSPSEKGQRYYQPQ